MYNYKRNINLDNIPYDINNGIISFDISNTGKNTVGMFKDGVTNLENKKNINQKNIYAIDDFSYVSDLTYLWDLHKLGMRILSLNGSDSGIYGSGNKTRCGLTFRGGILVKSAVSLNIALNISDSNKETINDIIKQYEYINESPFLISDMNKPTSMLEYLGTLDTFLLCNIDSIDLYDKLLKLVNNGYPTNRIIITGGNYFDRKNIFGKNISEEKSVFKTLKKDFSKDEIDNFINYNYKWLYDLLYNNGYIDDNEIVDEKLI